jgi:rhodanese-related sulfurtransferase
LAAAYVGDRDQLEPVTRQQLARRLRDGDSPVVLDVRPASEHAAGHLPGAVSIPVGELGRRLAELPPDQEIVAYCRGPFCAFAHEAVALLRPRALWPGGWRTGCPNGRRPGWLSPVTDHGGQQERAMLHIDPVLDEGLGNCAYVLELGDGRALVVDPARDPSA